MKKTGAWLVRYALEQIGVHHTFGIPGVHNTELYDELARSSQIEPVLVTHEGGGAFMADAVSRTGKGHIGTLVVVPAAGLTHAASGIGEAFLDGVPMLVLSGGIRSDSQYRYQLHDVDQHAMLKPITKGTWKITRHADIVPSIYAAYERAISDEPGPVYIEIPVNIQLDAGEVSSPLPEWRPRENHSTLDNDAIKRLAGVLARAKRPGLFLGWGAVDATPSAIAIAELLGAPVSVTLQGLSSFPANHPQFVGMSFGRHAVPAARAFENCDCLLAVGTRFSEIATGSFGMPVPEVLLHVDINPDVFDANWPARETVQGDAAYVLPALLAELDHLGVRQRADTPVLREQIARDRQAYMDEWFRHDVVGRVNPARFFQALRERLADDDFVVADDGNHTFLTAELMPIHYPRHFISPTDFNCMGYAVPAVIGTKLVNPQAQVVGIIGDGAFAMTAMEIMTAVHKGLGAVFAVFNDGELSQIAQAQQIPYNSKTCTVLPTLQLQPLAQALGAEYVAMPDNNSIATALDQALVLARNGKPVILDVRIDYSKRTRFTSGIVKTNLKRLPAGTAVRMVSRALWRRVKRG